MSPSRPSVVAVLYQDMHLFELGVAAEVFGGDRPDYGGPLFRLKFAQAEPGELRAAGGIRMRAHGGLALLKNADVVVIPGWRSPHADVPAPLLRALRGAHANGAKLVSICAGAFVLARTGLLDGKRATTHWRYADEFRVQFPQVALDPDVLYIDEGSVMTSAGSAAGIDASLHVVRQQFGADVANTVARAMVTSPHRSGGQAQYISGPVAVRAERSLAPVLDWARERLCEQISVSSLAQRAAMSERTLLRRFEAEVGESPKRWLQNERIGVARRLLESTGAPLQEVSEVVGFSTLTAFRSAFRQSVGVAPASYRQRFRG
jgi:AraC family transcriptional regulator, transcriptional activator FtrA